MSYRTLLNKYYNALNQMDINSAMSCFHSQNVTAPMFHQQMLELFAQFKVSTRLENSALVHQDDQYIIVEDTVLTEKISGADFQDNRTKTMHIFSKEANDEWKIHSSALLEVQPV